MYETKGRLSTTAWLSRMSRMEDQYRFLVGYVSFHGAGGADLRRGSTGRHHHH
jgi:hypothetical protein